MKDKHYILTLTKACNLNCDYCFVSHNDETMDFEVLKRIFHWIKTNEPNEKKKIFLFGGEPLLAFNLIKQIPQFLKDNNMINDQIDIENIVTNGLLLNEEMINFFAKQEILDLEFSLDGYDLESNKSRFGSDEQLFHKTIENIDHYAKKTNRESRIKMTITPHNVGNLYSNVKQFLEHGLSKISIAPAYGISWANADVDAFSTNMKLIIKLYKGLKPLKKFIEINPIDSYYKRIKENQLNEAGDCRLGNDIFFSTSGEAYACLMPVAWTDYDQREEYYLGHVETGIDMDKRDSFLESASCEKTESLCRHHFPIPCKKACLTRERLTGKPLDTESIGNLQEMERNTFINVFNNYFEKKNGIPIS